MNTDKTEEYGPYGLLINAIIQTSAIVAAAYGVVWAMYPVMAIACLLIVLQTLAVAGSFSGEVDTKVIRTPYPGIRSLTSLLFLASAWQIHLIGYSVFAGMMFAHAAITFSTCIAIMAAKK
jgi:hypothetical protein